MSRELKAALLNCMNHSSFPFGTQLRSISHTCLCALWSNLRICFLVFSNTAGLSFISLSYSSAYLFQSPQPSPGVATPLLCLAGLETSLQLPQLLLPVLFLWVGLPLLSAVVAVLLLISNNYYNAPHEVLLFWHSLHYLKGDDPLLGYFFPRFCLSVLYNSQISFHCSDSGTVLHKGLLSLVASGMNSPFSILLSLSFS